MQLNATEQDVSNQTKKPNKTKQNKTNKQTKKKNTHTHTHATLSRILQAVEWWLYSGGRSIQQQQPAKPTGRGSL